MMTGKYDMRMLTRLGKVCHHNKMRPDECVLINFPQSDYLVGLFCLYYISQLEEEFRTFLADVWGVGDEDGLPDSLQVS